MLMLLTYIFFFEEIHVFLQLSLIGLFGTKRACLHLEKPELQVLFLSNLTQFSQGNNVQDVPATDTNCFLLRDTCVSSTQVNKPFETKRAYFYLEKTKLKEIFLSNTNSILTGKQCARYSCF
jgi:hypothetical protein